MDCSDKCLVLVMFVAPIDVLGLIYAQCLCNPKDFLCGRLDRVNVNHEKHNLAMPTQNIFPKLSVGG